jgi:antitoxin MazE
MGAGVVWGRAVVSTMLTHQHWRRIGCPIGRPGIMKIIVKKWGNSASVRIPASVMAAAALSLDQAVDVREEAGRIVIEPIREEAFDLDDLVVGITDENRHEPIDIGPSVGREFW